MLRAIFSQITAEVRKKGIVPGDEEGSFYVSDRFSWKTSVRAFFDAYHKICERKQVSPLYQESKLGSALKVPYASIETVNLFRDGVARRLFQFRDLRIPPFSKLSANPSGEELRRMREASDDEDVRRFLEMVLLVDGELRRYVSRLDDLAAAYQMRLEAFAEAFSGAENEDVVRRKYQESRQRIDAVLTPYIGKLKKAGMIAPSWEYAYKMLPLTEEGRRYLSIMTFSPAPAEYWAKDVLPLKSVREADRKRQEEERAAAERKRREAKPAAPARSFGGRKRLWSVGLSRPSLWWRFDKGVAKIGRWFYYNMDDISDWPMYAWYILAGLTPLIILISAWVNSGFILALVLFLIGAALFEFLLGIVVIVGAGIKLLFKLPLLILRLLFYNGLTFILSLAAAGLGILWLTLQ